jgi:hypothetical protein
MSTPGDLLEALGREARARFGNGSGAATRVFRGRSVEELVPQIQRELGADAIIVRRREGLTGGMLGFFQRAFVEIEAMPGGPGVDLYDEEISAEPDAHLAPAPSPVAAPVHASEPARAFAPEPGFIAEATVAPEGAFEPEPLPDAPAPDLALAPAAPPVVAPPPAPPAPAERHRPLLGYQPLAQSRAVPERQPSPLVAPPLQAREPAAPATGAGSAYVTAHLAALARADRAKLTPRQRARSRAGEQLTWSAGFPGAQAVQEFGGSDALERTRRSAEREPAPRWPAASERREVAPGSSGRARTGVARSLQRYGIGEELASELIDSASAHALALAPRAGLAQAVRATLAQRIPVAPPLPTKGAAIVVVGAGGAGKTACCAALLGAYRKSSSMPASFATLTREPERGALQVVLSPYIMKPSPAREPRALRALRRARGEGMMVLDTPNVSPSDRTGIRELARLLGELEPERVVVALPATLGATAAAQLLQALRPLGAHALAVTHADETDQIGVAVEAACRFGLAPEYMLDRARAGGWRLRQTTPSALAEKLLP